MSLEKKLQNAQAVKIKQVRELIEMIGFEARNKYSIETEDGEVIGSAAEETKGFLGAVFRQILGHWRSFVIHIFGTDHSEVYLLNHPFRFYFERLEVASRSGELIGTIERRFSFLTKKFEVEDPHGRVIMSVASPIWRIWTFRFLAFDGRERAVVSKKWSGLGREMFLDADNFVLSFSSSDLTANERVLLLAAALFIDIRYFERKGSGGAFNIGDFLPGGN